MREAPIKKHAGPIWALSVWREGAGLCSSQRSNDSSPNPLFNDLKQKEIETKEGSALALVLWYETQLLIGQPNGGSPKFRGG